MQVPHKQLNPLSNAELTADETVILKWLRSVAWEAQKQARDPIPYKAKVPEFYTGVRLYRVQGSAVPTGGGAMGALDLFIKKMQFQGIVSKQNLYPVVTEGTARFLSLTREELENLGIRPGSPQHDDEED